jgi:hypothetical protein
VTGGREEEYREGGIGERRGEEGKVGERDRNRIARMKMRIRTGWRGRGERIG